MKLPNCDRAYVSPPKLIEYLLSETHIVGKSKAKYFRSCGFNENNVKLLEEELLAIAHAEPVKDVISSFYGTKYVVEGFLKTPNKTSMKIRTVWVIETKENSPRFVTAYPIK